MPGIDDLMRENGLNRSQKKFCKMSYNQNVRLLAPAGSGKTFSLLWRCRYITDICHDKQLTDPRFLLVAFTRAAKNELEERLRSEVFSDIKATVRTLNAWGWEQIRKPGKELIVSRIQKQNAVNHDLLPIYSKYENIARGFKSAYGRSNNSVILVELIDLMKTLGFTHLMTKNAYKSHIRYLKDVGLLGSLQQGYEELYRIMGIQNGTPKMKEDAVSEFFSFWKEAVVQLEANNRYTLEDQKYWARIYLEKQMKAGKYPQGITRYSHIMVDEFQDINPLDMALINAACQYNGQEKQQISLTIVGDDDQAIFGWRGTSPQYILHPDKFFNMDFKTCVLDTNYRSPKNIVEISSRLLAYNKDREPKEMKSAAKGKAIIQVVTRKRMLSSIETTLTLAKSLVEKKGCQKVALIGRRQVSLFPYQVLLSSEGIAYHVDQDLDIFEGEAMQSLQSIIQIVYRAKNDDVDNATEAVLTICDKIDRYKIQKKQRDEIAKYMDKKGVDSFSEALEALRTYPEEVKNYSGQELYDIISKLVASQSVYTFMQCVESDLKGLDKDYNKKDTDTHYKEPQFFRLAEISKKYGTDFRRFYRDIEKARKAGERSRSRDNDDSPEGYNEVNAINYHLITATRSKGHEYDAVIILDADNTEWPNQLSDDIEEERRLFYVALSRAKKYLYFVTSADQLESRFLLEAGLI